MDLGFNLVEHLLSGLLLEIKTLNFDLYDSPYKKIGEPSLCGQTKLISFVPESIVLNIVECMLSQQPILHVRPYWNFP